MSVIQRIDVRSLLLLDLQLSNVNNWVASAAIDNASDTTYATAGAVKRAYDLASYSHWNNSPVIGHDGGDANAHYNSAWDGSNVANAPSSTWHFFREMYHSCGGGWRHQEAFDFFNNEEYFRRSTDSGEQPWMRRWHSGNFNPDSKSNVGHGHAISDVANLQLSLDGKFSVNGTYHGTLTLSDWFRSTGNSGWYNETYGGGMYMSDPTWVRTFGGKKFYVDNADADAVNVVGGVKSYLSMTVDGASFTNQNAGDYNTNRVSKAPFYVGYSAPVGVGTFNPIVGGDTYTQGFGFLTKVKLGLLTANGAGWAKANLFVGGAESDGQPMANYTFDAYGNVAGIASLSMSGSLLASGANLPWSSLTITGSKGGYGGIHFSDVGHWFGIDSGGLSGVWNAAGVSKWYIDQNGVLGGGATVPWGIVTGKPARTNWVESDASNVVTGQLVWRHYGNNHTIFDASTGLSPNDTAIDNVNAQVPWTNNYPTLMGWNGATTYGVRVDSARRADSAGSANELTGGVITASWRDFAFYGKRAMVGFGASDGNYLAINYAGDFGYVSIQGPLFAQTIESNRHVAAQNGATAYNNGQLEAKTTDGTDVIIGLHRYGHSAAAIRHNSWGIIFEREGGAGTYSNVSGANFFANAAQDGSANALTRKDYVDTVANNSRWDNSPVIAHAGGDANAHYNSAWDGSNVANAPSSTWHFFREMYHSGGGVWRHQEAFDFFNNEEYFRRSTDSGEQPWMRRWHSGNFNPDSKSNVGHGHSTFLGSGSCAFGIANSTTDVLIGTIDTGISTDWKIFNPAKYSVTFGTGAMWAITGQESAAWFEVSYVIRQRSYWSGARIFIDVYAKGASLWHSDTQVTAWQLYKKEV